MFINRLVEKFKSKKYKIENNYICIISGFNYPSIVFNKDSHKKEEVINRC